ncbi:MAG: response regulator [Gammaproteobacteria bacterium]|nr:response regulator [Gammaproteobacteria bacterium]
MGLFSRLFGNFFSSEKKTDSHPVSTPTLSLESLHDIAQESASAQNQSTHQSNMPPIITKDITILIVDDSKTQIAACRKWLGDEGYHIITAGDGKEGILKTKKEHPDLILMDIVMPNINGYQATRYLKCQATTKHIPIVLISGEEQSSGRIWAKKLGACCFMVKPMDKNKLLSLTQKVLEHNKLTSA